MEMLDSQLEQKVNSQLLTAYSEAYARFSDMFYDMEKSGASLKVLRDANSTPQALSKFQLLKMLTKYGPFQKVLFVGHWHGLLPLLMHRFGLVRSAVGVEIDPLWVEFSNKLNAFWKWNSINLNALELTKEFFLEHQFDLIINTSSEHMPDIWLTQIPEGTLIACQSNNFKIPEHVNASNSLIEFKSKLKLTQIWDSYEQDFNVYKRFTLIGRK